MLGSLQKVVLVLVNVYVTYKNTYGSWNKTCRIAMDMWYNKVFKTRKPLYVIVVFLVKDNYS